MAAWIVERELIWCRAQIIRVLGELGFRIESSGAQSNTIRGVYYAEGFKKLFLRPRPKVRVDLAPVSSQATRVAVSPQYPWWLMIAYAAPFVCFALAASAGRWLFIVIYELRLWSHPILLPFAVLSLLVVLQFILIVGSLAKLASVVLSFYLDLECLIGNRLHPEGEEFHVIECASSAFKSHEHVFKWVSLSIMVVGGLLVVSSMWLPTCDSVWTIIEDNLDAVLGKVAIYSLLSVALPPGAPLFGLCFISCGGLGLMTCSYLICSWRLPYRYHWKLRFYGTYVCWYFAMLLPILLASVDYGLRSTSVPAPDLQEFIRISGTITILVFQLLSLGALLKMLPEFKEDRDDNDYKLPSTRYETLSEQSVEGDIRLLSRQHRFWTWTNFLVFTALCYITAAYLLTILAESLCGIFWTPGALNHFWLWPTIVPMQNRGEAVQAAILASLMGSPLVIAFVQLVRRKLRLSARWTLGSRIANGMKNPGLPDAPLVSLKRNLKAAVLQVVLVPSPRIDMRVERMSLVKRKYVLWLTIGAQKNLSQDEIEALLWHECGHRPLLKPSIWKELLGLAGFWAPRFLDLADDLYSQERKADLYAAQKMGTAEPLRSALQKRKSQQNTFSKKEQQESSAINRRVSWDALKMIWSLGWVGYLHPDINQRLRWLEEWEKQNMANQR